ncbi:MAG TPA: ferritin-like domain-containing protein [Sandaracinaceae bacterium]
MIDLAPSRTPLDRFVRELEAQAPRSIAGLAPSLEGASPEDVRAARLAWSARARDEYRSVLVFTELLGLLARAGAPFDALAAVQRLIGDELRHVRLCLEVAGWFGPPLSSEIDPDPLPPIDEPIEARAIEIVARELLVAEEESVLVLRAYRDATSDAACRTALAILLADEVRHAAAGRWLLPRLAHAFAKRPIGGTLARLGPVLEEDRAHIRAQHAAGATGGPGRRFGASIEPHEAP